MRWGTTLIGVRLLPAAEGHDLPADYLPQDDYERDLIAQVPLFQSDPPPGADATAQTQPKVYERRVDRGRAPSVPVLSADVRAGSRVWIAIVRWGKCRTRNLQKDELMAVVRVTIDDQATVNAQARNRALPWTAAIVVGFLSMISLWAVVRYVIVKPVTHLRDVANAVREGDVEQRA